MLLWLPFALKRGLQICRGKPIDVIYTTSPPHSSHLTGLILSKWLRKPWVADFRDPWTLNADCDKSFLKNILLRIEKVMERGVLRNASIILANTMANRQNLLQAFPFLKEEKVFHLPNGWEEFSELDYEKRRDGPFTIVHAGTFYARFKPYALLYALAKWRNSRNSEEFLPWSDDIKVILLGSSEEETRKTVDDLGLEDFVEIRPWVGLEEARKIMCQADLLWASLGTGKESSTYIPSKLFEYIAAKRPILGFFPRGEAERLIKETGTGLVFSNDDFPAVIKSIYDAIRTKGKKEPSWFHPWENAILRYHIENIALNLALILEQSIKSLKSCTFLDP
jgi:hypothetical protein